MEQELLRLKDQAQKDLDVIKDLAGLEDFRIQYLGRKGACSTVMKQLGTAAAEDRPRLGQLANTIKNEISAWFEEKKSSLSGHVLDSTS